MRGEPGEARLAAKSPRKPAAFAPRCVTNTLPFPAEFRSGLNQADGQIDGEVYVYGSVLQSRMYQAGVNCSNCHDANSLEPRIDGNGLCAQCHQADKYDATAHAVHAASTPGAQCVNIDLRLTV